MPIVSPDKFAAEFNSAVPGAYRKVDADDVRDMAECDLIGKYGYYGHVDIQLVRAILLYEQLRQNRQKKDEIRDSDGAIHCRRCGAVLAAKPDGERGRPKEYCTNCESYRGRERYKKWRRRQVAVLSVY